MKGVKEFLTTLGDFIIDDMEKKGSQFTRKCVADIAGLCEDYEAICEFVKSYQEHKSGSLYEDVAPAKAAMPANSTMLIGKVKR